MLVASYTLLKAERGPESKDTMKALDALSTLYEASGQTDKAVAYRALQAPSSR